MSCKDCERNSHMWDIVINEQRYTPKPGHFVLDLGMLYGHFTFYCASRGAFVKGYEPIPPIFQGMQGLLKKEPWRDNVNAVNKAVWSDEGWRGMNYNSENTRSSSLVTAGSYSVQTETLRTAMKDVSWDCVKVDIEGSEFEVFAKVEQDLLDRINYLTMEIHNDVLTKGQHDALIARLKAGFPTVVLEEQYTYGNGLGVYNKAFCLRS